MYINTKEFAEDLDGWLFKNQQSYAAKINSNKTKIPTQMRTCTTPLYRGMTVDSDFLEKAKSGIKFTNFTSWSLSPKIAESFVKDPKYKVGTKIGVKILITKKIPPSQIVLHVYNVCLFNDYVLTGNGLDESSLDSAMKEQEVLINKGVVIKLSDISFIK